MGYNRAVSRALDGFGYTTETLGFFVTTPPGLLNRMAIPVPALAVIHYFCNSHVQAFNAVVREAYARLKPDVVLVIRGSKLLPQTLAAVQSSV